MDKKLRSATQVITGVSAVSAATTKRGVLNACQICNKKFGTFLKEHQCKRCVRAVCDDCSKAKSKIIGYEVKPSASHRVCKLCKEESDFQADYRTKFAVDSEVGLKWWQALKCEAITPSKPDEGTSEIFGIDQLNIGSLRKELNYSSLEFVHYVTVKEKEERINELLLLVVRDLCMRMGWTAMPPRLDQLSLIVLCFLNEEKAIALLEAVLKTVMPDFVREYLTGGHTDYETPWWTQARLDLGASCKQMFGYSELETKAVNSFILNESRLMIATLLVHDVNFQCFIGIFHSIVMASTFQEMEKCFLALIATNISTIKDSKSDQHLGILRNTKMADIRKIVSDSDSKYQASKAKRSQVRSMSLQSFTSGSEASTVDSLRLSTTNSMSEDQINDRIKEALAAQESQFKEELARLNEKFEGEKKQLEEQQQLLTQSQVSEQPIDSIKELQTDIEERDIQIKRLLVTLHESDQKNTELSQSVAELNERIAVISQSELTYKQSIESLDSTLKQKEQIGIQQEQEITAFKAQVELESTIKLNLEIDLNNLKATVEQLKAAQLVAETSTKSGAEAITVELENEKSVRKQLELAKQTQEEEFELKVKQFEKKLLESEQLISQKQNQLNENEAKFNSLNEKITEAMKLNEQLQEKHVIELESQLKVISTKHNQESEQIKTELIESSERLKNQLAEKDQRQHELESTIASLKLEMKQSKEEQAKLNEIAKESAAKESLLLAEEKKAKKQSKQIEREQQLNKSLDELRKQHQDSLKQLADSHSIELEKVVAEKQLHQLEVDSLKEELQVCLKEKDTAIEEKNGELILKQEEFNKQMKEIQGKKQTEFSELNSQILDLSKQLQTLKDAHATQLDSVNQLHTKERNEIAAVSEKQLAESLAATLNVNEELNSVKQTLTKRESEATAIRESEAKKALESQARIELVESQNKQIEEEVRLVKEQSEKLNQEVEKKSKEITELIEQKKKLSDSLVHEKEQHQIEKEKLSKESAKLREELTQISNNDASVSSVLQHEQERLILESEKLKAEIVQLNEEKEQLGLELDSEKDQNKKLRVELNEKLAASEAKLVSEVNGWKIKCEADVKAAEQEEIKKQVIIADGRVQVIEKQLKEQFDSQSLKDKELFEQGQKQLLTEESAKRQDLEKQFKSEREAMMNQFRLDKEKEIEGVRKQCEDVFGKEKIELIANLRSEKEKELKESENKLQDAFKVEKSSIQKEQGTSLEKLKLTLEAAFALEKSALIEKNQVDLEKAVSDSRKSLESQFASEKQALLEGASGDNKRVIEDMKSELLKSFQVEKKELSEKQTEEFKKQSEILTKQFEKEKETELLSRKVAYETSLAELKSTLLADFEAQKLLLIQKANEERQAELLEQKNKEQAVFQAEKSAELERFKKEKEEVRIQTRAICEEEYKSNKLALQKQFEQELEKNKQLALESASNSKNQLIEQMNSDKLREIAALKLSLSQQFESERSQLVSSFALEKQSEISSIRSALEQTHRESNETSSKRSKEEFESLKLQQSALSSQLNESTLKGNEINGKYEELVNQFKQQSIQFEELKQKSILEIQTVQTQQKEANAKIQTLSEELEISHRLKEEQTAEIKGLIEEKNVLNEQNAKLLSAEQEVIKGIEEKQEQIDSEVKSKFEQSNLFRNSSAEIQQEWQQLVSSPNKNKDLSSLFLPFFLKCVEQQPQQYLLNQQSETLHSAVSEEQELRESLSSGLKQLPNGTLLLNRSGTQSAKDLLAMSSTASHFTSVSVPSSPRGRVNGFNDLSVSSTHGTPTSTVTSSAAGTGSLLMSPEVKQHMQIRLLETKNEKLRENLTAFKEVEKINGELQKLLKDKESKLKESKKSQKQVEASLAEKAIEIKACNDRIVELCAELKAASEFEQALLGFEHVDLVKFENIENKIAALKQGFPQKTELLEVFGKMATSFRGEIEFRQSDLRLYLDKIRSLQEQSQALMEENEEIIQLLIQNQIDASQFNSVQKQQHLQQTRTKSTGPTKPSQEINIHDTSNQIKLIQARKNNAAENEEIKRAHNMNCTSSECSIF